MSITRLLTFENIVDQRGSLIVLEALKNIPFEVRRIYYMTNLSSDNARGFHAHKDLTQVAICLNGYCRFVLDNGSNREEIILNAPDQGLLITSMIWREMYDFSTDCVLLVLANQYYDESDYIRNYNQFLQEVNNGKN